MGEPVSTTTVVLGFGQQPRVSYDTETVLEALKGCYGWARDAYAITCAVWDMGGYEARREKDRVFRPLAHARRTMRNAQFGEATRDHLVAALVQILPYADSQVESLYYQWGQATDAESIATMQKAWDRIARAYEITGLPTDRSPLMRSHRRAA